MAQEPVLPFEAFASEREGLPYFDNFFLFWADGEHGEFYRTFPPYAGLRQEAPNLEARLREGIPKREKGGLRPFYKDLYEAYLVMRKYVSSDTDLSLPVQQPK